MSRKKIDLLILTFVVVVGVVAAKNAVLIGDWIHGLRYKPTPEIVKLADDAGMNDYGQKMFYRFSPQYLSKDGIADACGGEKLGCAEGQNIFILEGISNRENMRSIVTASHEMLHIGYSRLSQADKNKLHNLITEQTKTYPDADIKKQLDTIPEGDYFNEAHSYIGSQQSNLLPKLETYYKTYFADRSKTVEAYQNSPEG